MKKYKDLDKKITESTKKYNLKMQQSRLYFKYIIERLNDVLTKDNYKHLSCLQNKWYYTLQESKFIKNL